MRRHLLHKETLSIEKIEKLLSLIPLENRAEFDSELIEEMYVNMQSCAIDDSDSINSLNLKLRIEAFNSWCRGEHKNT